VDGKIILRWIFRKWDVGVWTGSSWLRIAGESGKEQQVAASFVRLVSTAGV
jgi:hypothetical protein